MKKIPIFDLLGAVKLKIPDRYDAREIRLFLSRFRVHFNKIVIEGLLNTGILQLYFQQTTTPP